MKKLFAAVLALSVFLVNVLPAAAQTGNSVQPSPASSVIAANVSALNPMPDMSPSPQPNPTEEPLTTVTPSLAPTPEATASPTPMLTPVPGDDNAKKTRDNRAPVITTDEMNPGMVGWPFIGIVLAVEFDDEDPVKLEVLDLPQGLLSAHCASITWNIPSFAYCFVLGVPTQAGVHHATVRATDSLGAVSEKKVKMSFYTGIPLPFNSKPEAPSIDELEKALLEDL